MKYPPRFRLESLWGFDETGDYFCGLTRVPVDDIACALMKQSDKNSSVRVIAGAIEMGGLLSRRNAERILFRIFY